jgi:uncharacterized protein involved in exopolysaccharide biosynthesis
MSQEAMDRVGTTESCESPLVVEEQGEGSIDLVELLRRLWQGRRPILEVALGVLAISAAVAYLLPVKYTSTFSFIPPTLSNSSSMASLVAGQLSSMGASELLGGSKSPGDLYAGILKSRSIAGELVQRFDLRKVYGVKRESQAEKKLGANTDVTLDAKSTIVTVDVTDKSPQRAHDLANGYMDALRETNGRLALSQSSQRRLFFGQQLAKEKDDLEDAEVALKQTEEQSGLIAPTGQTESEIKSIADLQAAIAVRQVQLAALRDSATEENPDVIRLHSEIDDLQGQLARMQKGSGNQPTMSIPTSKVPEVELEYVRKDREVKYHEALFDMLARQYEAARLDEARDAPVLQVLDAASYPDAKSSPKRMLIMLGGLIFGFIAGCVWVLIREHVYAMRAALASNHSA